MLNDAHVLHAVEVYIQCFQQNLENNALIELFCQLVDEPCFDQLRTKEQLGYIVSSGTRRSRGVQGFRVIVQSTRDLEYVNQRIELFLDSMKVKEFSRYPLLEYSQFCFRIISPRCQMKIFKSNAKVVLSEN